MLVALVLSACGSGRGGADSADGGVDGGGHGDAGSAGADGSAHFADGAASDSGTSCDNPLDRAGCPCPSGSAPRQCYTGPAAKAGVGACTFGTQSCMHQGESNGTWGACVGSGTPTTCAAASAQCGTLSDGCGGTLDCGSCPSGQPCNANRCGTQSDSCRHLALAYGSANFPSTVCVLAANGSVECAVNPADPVGTGAALVPSSTLSQLACISGGEDFFCAVTNAGGVVCWGDEAGFDPAHIGTGPLTGANIVNETLAIPGVTSAIDVAAGETHVCVLTASRSVMCWGNGYGEVNTGSWVLPASPTAVDIGGPATTITSGDGFSCALRQDGVVLCWGNNARGVLGDGTTTSSATPVAVSLPTKAVGVWADQASSPCALLQDGSVWCWGNGASPPKQVTGFSGPVAALTVGGEFDVSCALLAAGGVQCWSASTSPVDILPAGSGVVELRSLDADYCVLGGSGSVTCWYNSDWDPGGVQFGTGVSVPGL